MGDGADNSDSTESCTNYTRKDTPRAVQFALVEARFEQLHFGSFGLVITAK